MCVEKNTQLRILDSHQRNNWSRSSSGLEQHKAGDSASRATFVGLEFAASSAVARKSSSAIYARLPKHNATINRPWQHLGSEYNRNRRAQLQIPGERPNWVAWTRRRG